MGVPMLMLGIRLCWTYDSVRRLTKSTQKLSILRVAVSRCLDFSGLEVIRATLLIRDLLPAARAPGFEGREARIRV